MNSRNDIQTFYEALYSESNYENRFNTFKGFQHSGLSLVNQINRDAKILDIGCGENFLKPFFPNLFGIDPASELADQKISIDDYVTSDEFDVILCLGSIQYGDLEYVKTQTRRIVSMLKPGGSIFWRSILAANNTSTLPIFIWTPDLHRTLANEFGCCVAELKTELNTVNQKRRLFAKWLKN